MQRALRQIICRSAAKRTQAQHRESGPSRRVEPDWMTGRCQCGMRQGEPERFGDNLRCCCGAEELATASGCCAGAASNFSGVFGCDLPCAKRAPIVCTFLHLHRSRAAR